MVLISLHVIPWSFWKYLDRSVQIILTQNNYFRQALIVEQFFRYQLIPWWWLPDLLANLTLNDPLFHRISIAWKNVLNYWSKTIYHMLHKNQIINGHNYLPTKPEIVAFNTSRWGTSKNNGFSIPWEGEFDILDSKYGDKYCWENFEMPLSTVLLKAWAIPSIKLLIGFIDWLMSRENLSCLPR